MLLSPLKSQLHPNPSLDQVLAGIHGFFWPKVFWDFLTKNLDSAVKPVPALQILNLLFGLFGIAYEWPLSFIAGTGFHRSIEIRLIIYPLSALVAILMYQSTNAGLYYIVGMIVYFWAYSEGEVRVQCSSPFTYFNANPTADCL